MKRVIAILLAAVIVLTVMPMAFAASLNYTSKSIYYGKKVTLKVQSGTASSWTSSNTNIATVNNKGVVRGVGIGTAYITANVGGQKLSCKVKVKDRNVAAAVSFKTTTGGIFINRVNEAVIGVKPLNYNAGKATVYIKDAADEIVYKTTLTNLTKNQGVYPHWNGKTNKGAVVPNGTYTAFVKIGKTVSKSNALAFLQKNYFAGGDGSAKNPFQVATTEQLKQIVRYPNACFKQTSDLDFGYESVGDFFQDEDQMFAGIYDGANRAISNITASHALFCYVGEKGVLKNIEMRNCNILGSANNDVYAALVSENYGRVSNCDIHGNVSVNINELINASIICATNKGTISNSVCSGTVSCHGQMNGLDLTNAIVGGAVCGNEGKVISCESHVNISAETKGVACAGGIVGRNKGLVSDCEADGEIFAEGYGYLSEAHEFPAGIAGKNEGQIMRCVYTGTSDVPLVGINEGIID